MDFRIRKINGRTHSDTGQYSINKEKELSLTARASCLETLSSMPKSSVITVFIAVPISLIAVTIVVTENAVFRTEPIFSAKPFWSVRLFEADFTAD